MANVVQSQIVHEHAIPIILAKLCSKVPRDVVVHFDKVLESHLMSCYSCAMYRQRGTTDRNKEARSTVCSCESFRKQFQPSIITIHRQFPARFVLQLRQPRVLMCQIGRRIRLGKIQDYIEERRNRAGGHGLHSRHSNGRRCGMGSEWYGSTRPDQPGSC